MGISSKLIVLAACLIYFQANYFILNEINQYVDSPYMDEIFHVPQAQDYCLGNYDKVSSSQSLFEVSYFEGLSDWFAVFTVERQNNHFTRPLFGHDQSVAVDCLSQKWTKQYVQSTR